MRVACILTTNKPEHKHLTSDIARLYISRALLQAHMWKNAHVPVPDIMSNELFFTGFILDEQNNSNTPIMMTKSPMSKSVIKIILCNCKSSCATKNVAALNLSPATQLYVMKK